MKQVIVLKGLPGSGKSSWAKNLIAKNPNAYKRVNKDDLRDMVDGGKWSKDSEKLIIILRDIIIMEALDNGNHVIVDDTNLHPKHEERIRELVKGKAEVVIQDFTDISVQTCIKNDLNRDRSVGEKVIRDMYNQFLKPKQESIPYNDYYDDIVICDLDGTLSLLNGRNPYDASTCVNDLLNTFVADLIRNEKVIFVSGREDKYRQQTKEFLKNHNIDYIALHMRKTDDTRKDYIIKKEIFDNHIRNKYNVKYVVDDRLQVCRLWYSLGLNLLRVGDPEADF